MWLTLLAIACVAGFAFYPDFLPINITAHELAAFMVLGGTVVLILTVLLNTLVLQPISKLEQKLVPNLIDLFRRHVWLRICLLLLFVTVFLSYILAIALLSLDASHRLWIVWAWIIIFAISLDLLRDNWNALLNLLNPHHLVKEFEHTAISAIQNSQDEPLWQSIDSLAEVAFNSVEHNKIAISKQAIETFPPIMHAFFASSKSISRPTIDEEIEKQTGQDEASYTVFYLLQRLESIYDKALRNRLEPICRQMIMSLGKIIVYGANLDLSLVTFPTHFLAKFGLKAQQHHFQEVAELTTSTLLEIVRSIIENVDLTYAELIEPFQAIINGLDSLAKGEFKQNKYANIKVLVQPLLDMKELLKNPKIANHRDAPAIRQSIDSVLAEFEALEQVMRALPTIPDVITEESSENDEESPPPS